MNMTQYTAGLRGPRDTPTKRSRLGLRDPIHRIITGWTDCMLAVRVHVDPLSRWGSPLSPLAPSLCVSLDSLFL